LKLDGHDCNYQIFPHRSRKDFDKARNEADEKAVKDVINIIKSMVNPFENYHKNLMHKQVEQWLPTLSKMT
jgi:hypothetical protein